MGGGSHVDADHLTVSRARRPNESCGPNHRNWLWSNKSQSGYPNDYPDYQRFRRFGRQRFSSITYFNTILLERNHVYV